MKDRFPTFEKNIFRDFTFCTSTKAHYRWTIFIFVYIVKKKNRGKNEPRNIGRLNGIHELVEPPLGDEPFLRFDLLPDSSVDRVHSLVVRPDPVGLNSTINLPTINILWHHKLISTSLEISTYLIFHFIKKIVEAIRRFTSNKLCSQVFLIVKKNWPSSTWCPSWWSLSLNLE